MRGGRADPEDGLFLESITSLSPKCLCGDHGLAIILGPQGLCRGQDVPNYSMCRFHDHGEDGRQLPDA